MTEPHDPDPNSSQDQLTLLGPIKLALNPILGIGHTILELIGLISVALSASPLLLNKKRRRIFLSLFFRQIYNTGVKALYINGAVAVLIGAVLISRLFEYLPQQVFNEQFGYFFMVIVFRELGPLISGIILIARSATAVTAEIGYLRPVSYTHLTLPTILLV